MLRIVFCCVSREGHHLGFNGLVFFGLVKLELFLRLGRRFVQFPYLWAFCLITEVIHSVTIGAVYRNQIFIELGSLFLALAFKERSGAPCVVKIAVLFVPERATEYFQAQSFLFDGAQRQ